MLSRCYNTNCNKYSLYGARGVRVCSRWRHNFSAFINDMGKRPSSNRSIDRINNNGDYSPDNCRWATRNQQDRNRRDNHLVTYDGVTLTIAEWSERASPSSTLTTRMVGR
jgi:hypothetical protein